MSSLPNWSISAVVAGGGTSPPPSGVAPGNVQSITVSGFIDPVSGAMTLTVGVVPPATIGTFIGCHVYLEVPDQSGGTAAQVGSQSASGSALPLGFWVPIDCGSLPYVASQQPWIISNIPAPPSVSITANTPARIYCVSFSAAAQNPLVEANQTGASPNQTFELISLASGTPTSGTNITGLTVASGAQVGIVATALAPVNVTGKLETPVVVLVTDTPTAPPGWCFQLVLTFFGQDPTDPMNQYVVSGIETTAGQVVAGADGVSVPHSFLLQTPTTVTTATVWLQAGLVNAAGVFVGNNIVPGITPQFSFTYGSTVGTTDASAIMTATITSAMAIVSGLFGVAPAGITNSLIGTGAVATINIQALAVTNPLLAALAVQAANLATGSVTSTAIAALAVGTAAIQTGAITNALIANAAVANANIITATITGASIASATIAGANIGTATIAQANLASLSVGTAQIQSASITGAKIASATITAANITTCNISSLLAGTASFTGTVTLGINSSSTQVVLSSSGIQLISGTSSAGISLDTAGDATFTNTSATSTTIQGNVIVTSTISCNSITISPAVGFGINFGSGFPTSGTASAGSATLPSTPVGFLVVEILGTNYKIPYYNT